MNPDIPYIYSLAIILLVFGILFYIVQAINFGMHRLGYTEGRRRKISTAVSLSLFSWLIISELLAFSGYLKDYPATPPHIYILYLVPMTAAVLLLFSRQAGQIIMEIPPSRVLNAQTVRVVTELVFYGLYFNGILAKRMTFLGSNYDILIGLLAPFISYYCFTRKFNKYYAIIFNVLGILFHLTLVLVAFYSVPGPSRLIFDNPANTLFGYFPFVWLPAFITPFIFTMHFFSLKQLIKAKMIL